MVGCCAECAFYPAPGRLPECSFTAEETEAWEEPGVPVLWITVWVPGERTPPPPQP